ncbi:hypothetical protein Q5762_23410 [Streptomyces sp. P9(2023)]|nr:hypothetical protein [Streptomyces sp. P9(2023)]MDT9691242.1 hypothetical protein [Streptomyces sp. P9(2023)]
MNTYETSEEARAALALLHDYTEVDDLLSEVVPWSTPGPTPPRPLPPKP